MALRYQGSCDKALTQEDQDKLALKHYAKGLAAFIKDCNTPMTIGVQGEWGSGKTSLMKLVESKLKVDSETDDSHPFIIDHWFDTWQYGAVGNADVLGVRLLQDLVTEIRAAGSKDDMGLFRKAEDVSRKVMGIMPGLLRSAAIGAATTASGGMLDRDSLAEAVPGGASAPGVGDLRTAFGELVKAVVTARSKKKAGARLVVFIDDLDRIRPGRAVALLEILKNFMDVDDAVFVVACDYDVVQEGVHDLMGIDEPEKVRAFFEKIFQVPFEMPSASYSVQPMLIEWLEGKVGTQGQATLWARNLAPLVEAALGTNPRAFKRFLNTVDLQCAVDAAYPHKRTAGLAETDPAYHLVKVQRFTGTDKGVQRWVTSLLGMFALQAQWPEVAAYLQYDALAEKDAQTAARRFERALRTLIGDWSNWSATEGGARHPDSEEEQPDERIVVMLQRSYSGPGLDEDWRQHPKVEQLAEFARLWFTALDQPTGGGHDHELAPEEVAYLWRWSQRMVSQRGSGAARRGKWAFMDEAHQLSSKSADAFLGLVDTVEQWIDASERLSCTYGNTGLWVRLQGVGGKPQPFMQFVIKEQRLFLRVRATSNADGYFGLTGVGAVGTDLATKLTAAGMTPYEHYGFLNVDFAKGHKDGSAAQTQQLILAFRELISAVDGLEVLSSDSAEAAAADPVAPISEAPPAR